MVSIGAARVVLLLAGLWRAPEETGVPLLLAPWGARTTHCDTRTSICLDTRITKSLALLRSVCLGLLAWAQAVLKNFFVVPR